MSMNLCMDKQTVAYRYNRVLFRYKKVQISYIPNTIVETYRYYSEQKKKKVTKEYIVKNSIFMRL